MELFSDSFSFSSFSSSAIATIIHCCFILCFVHHHLRLILLVLLPKEQHHLPFFIICPFCARVIISSLFFCFCDLWCTFLTFTRVTVRCYCYSSLSKKEVDLSSLLRKEGEDAKQRQQQSTAPLFLLHHPHSSAVVVVRIFRLHTTNERAMAHVWEKSRSV